MKIGIVIKTAGHEAPQELVDRTADVLETLLQQQGLGISCSFRVEMPSVPAGTTITLVPSDGVFLDDTKQGLLRALLEASLKIASQQLYE